MLTKTKTELRTLKIRFELEATDPIMLGEYKGSALRGSLGHALKRMACFSKQNCSPSCAHPRACPYGYLFETPPPEGSERMTKYPTVPHPFVLVPPLETKTNYAPGDPFFFEMVLIGKGTEYLPYFVYAFERQSEQGLGKGRGRYRLKAVRTENGELLYDGDEKVLTRDGVDRSVRHTVIDFTGSRQTRVSLTLLTPLRLKFQETLGAKPEFHILTRNLLRRVSNLLYFHEGIEPDWKFKELIEAASQVRLVSDKTRWYDWERFSTRQNARMALGGFIGEISYEGNIGPFMDLVRLGEIVHVGKGTSFGLGRYRIETGNDSHGGKL